MSRLFPKSLFGQTLLILLTGLAVSHLIGAWIYTADREQAVRAVGGLTLAQRVANVTQLVVLAPVDWRERIVASSNDPSFRVSLSPRPPAFANSGQDAPAVRAIGEFLAGRLPDGAVRQIRVAVSDAPGPPFAMGRGHGMRMGPMMHAVGAWRGLQVAVQIAGGQWLSFASVLPESGPAVSRQFILSMAVMAVIILVVSIWAVRRVTAPLGNIAQAAERLGKDIAVAPLAEIGTIEMRRAAQAFNGMQARLRRFVNDRTRMLAAISHDLRTPLTLLRLRAEDVENAEERERMLATIDDMIVMIEATLAFARDEASAEPRRRIDLTALVASVVDDMAAAGRAVTMAASPSVICECEPGALKRTVSNLIDNAVKYGKAAHVAIETIPGTVTIIVDDEGPGIPEEELGQVFQPFYRVEESRSRETGGIGLGLAIAQSIAQAHGGEITLSNRPEGGLRATIALPV
jgi:signal transduction histidine kinase